jgi:hypothetical protein
MRFQSKIPVNILKNQGQLTSGNPPPGQGLHGDVGSHQVPSD